MCAINPRPCCNCGHWASGIAARKWVVQKAVADCKDRHQKVICNAMKDAGMCWSGFVKTNCESTCGICTKPEGQDYADDMTGREVVSFPGGKNFVGTVSGGKPNGKGVFTWGNLIRHVGLFKDGQPAAGESMARVEQDGALFLGTYKNWANDKGLYWPALSVTKDAMLAGKWNADGTLSSGAITWANTDY